MAFAITPATIAIAASEELQGIFNDTLDTARRGEANYLVGGTPTSLTGKVSQAAGRSACRIYGQGNVTINAGAAEKYERVCRPYLETLDPLNGPKLEIPARGGQCDGVTYSFAIGRTSFNGTALTDQFVQCSAGRRGPIGKFKESTGPNTENIGITFKDATGATVRANILSGTKGASITLKNFARCDAAPDNCGNAPVDVTPPSTVTDPTPPPFRFNPDPSIDIDIDVTVAPTGDITFNIGTGPITIDPFGGGDGGGGPGPDPDPGLPPGDVGAPAAPIETGPGGSGPGGGTAPGTGEAEGTAPPGSELVGLRLQLLTEPPSRTKYTDLVRRGAIYVYMGVPGLLDHDPAGAMITPDQFIFAERDRLTAWKVRANKGYNFRITPYYREVT